MKCLDDGNVRFTLRFTWGIRAMVLAVLHGQEVTASMVPEHATYVRVSKRSIRTAVHHAAYSFGDSLAPLEAALESRYGENWMEQPDIAALAERIRKSLVLKRKSWG